ncbi:MAG: dihydropteroate synthase [Rikenellaceae bacterium]
MVDLGRRHIMAILNVTPDSFYAGSRTSDSVQIRARIERVVDEGATIIDIGGYSSRPNAEDIPMEQEWERVNRALTLLKEMNVETTISIDTFRAEVARRAANEYGELIINDITAGDGDAKMVETVAELKLPYVAMHTRGTPQTMQSLTEYEDVVGEVFEYLAQRAKYLNDSGIEQVILDPGFGFAKTIEQNYQLLRGLDRFSELGYPLLVGVSRKSMIYRLLDIDPKDSLAGTTALHWEALQRGAKTLRVHDVAEAVQVLKIFEEYEKYD